MITDGEKWHYIAVKKLSSLFKGMTSNYKADCYGLDFLHSFRTEK